MPTALAQWTPERPDAPGFYWWMERPGDTPEVAFLEATSLGWRWSLPGLTEAYGDGDAAGALWWPVRLDPPPVG